MVQLRVRFDHPTFSDQQIAESIVEILRAHNTLSMATVSPGGQSYINTAHYGFDDLLNLFIVTPTFTQHSQNVYANPSVAVAIWNEPAVIGTDLRGLQLFGTCARVQPLDLMHAIEAYATHVPAYGVNVKTPADTEKSESKLHILNITRLKLLDEPAFGRRNSLTLDVRGK